MPSLVNATFWSAIQRFGGLAIGFISNIVLARLLCPEDYGVVGLIMVFIGIADVLVDGGLGNALIQKKDVSKDDISTVFSSNLVISLLLFFAVFFTAPAIASYVEIDNFAFFLRVEAIMILLRALYVVHFSMMNREMDFQRLAKINLSVNFVSTVVAISMAYFGCGVWSLIVRNLSLDFFSLLAFYVVYKVRFSVSINKDSFRQLFRFGMYVGVANLLETLYSNILSFILGKKFSVKELGYYNQAYALEQIPVYSITSILNQVFFPFLSKEQEDRVKMKSDINSSIHAMSFCIYPIMTYLICFANPIILLLYGEKWLPAVPFFQILCVIGFVNFLYHISRSILKAIDKTRVLFYIQIGVCILGLSLVFFAIPFGIYVVVLMVVTNSLISALMLMFVSGKYIKNSLREQLGSVVLNLIIALLAGLLTVWLFSFIKWSPIFLLCVSFIFYACVYIGAHYVIKSKSYQLVYSVVKRYIKNK